MNQFYLNDCLGSKPFGVDELSDGLITVVQAFYKISSVPKLLVDKGWVIEKIPADVLMAGTQLQDVVNNMRDKESRRLFYVYCTKYPIHKHFTQIDDDVLLAADYRFRGSDATNVVITANNGGILMTLPVAYYLKQNTIVAQPSNKGYGSIQVPNLHGSTAENVAHITRVLLDKNYATSSGLDKLSCLAPEVYFTDYFLGRFKKLTNNDIQSIFDRIDEARNGNMIQPLKCNGTVISHVEKHVSELRIVNPVDIRIYFHEEGNTLYFARLAFKSEYGVNGQNEDIKKAEEMIVEMMKQ